MHVGPTALWMCSGGSLVLPHCGVIWKDCVGFETVDQIFYLLHASILLSFCWFFSVGFLARHQTVQDQFQAGSKNLTYSKVRIYIHFLIRNRGP